MDDDRKKLGRILLTQRVVTSDELEAMLKEQKAQPGKRIGAVAVETGRVSRLEILRALSEQHGIPAVDLRQAVMPLEHLALIPEDIARQHLILPVQVTPEQLVLAMADPSDKRIVEEIEFVSGRRVLPYVAMHDELAHVIAAVYQLAESGKSHFVGPDVTAQTLKDLGVDPAQAGSRASLAPRTGGPTPSLIPTVPPVVRAAPRPAAERFTTLSKPAPGHDSVSLPRGFFPNGPGLPATAPASLKPAPSNKKRVLVVDDEEDIRRLLKKLLEGQGHEVIEASRGSEALELVRDAEPHLILLDAMLPEVHGFEICRRIKASKRYGHVPIIMISAIYRGWRVAEDLIQTYGVEAFIEKPFRIDDVAARVTAALAGKSQLAALAEPAEKLSAEAEAKFGEGMAAYEQGDVTRAIGFLKEGVAIDPLSFQLHYYLGLMFGRGDSVFEAIHELEAAVDLAPRHFSALKNLAVLYQKAGFRHKAVELWERALRSATDDDTRQGIKEHLLTLL
jgi:DNA-binding response OmpR family regulator